jgi:hypothetical protein
VYQNDAVYEGRKRPSGVRAHAPVLFDYMYVLSSGQARGLNSAATCSIRIIRGPDNDDGSQSTRFYVQRLFGDAHAVCATATTTSSSLPAAAAAAAAAAQVRTIKRMCDGFTNANVHLHPDPAIKGLDSANPLTVQH